MVKTMKKLHILSLILVTLGAVFLFNRIANHKSSRNSGSGRNQQALIGGEFHLIDQKKRKRSNHDFKNKHLLVYFGYSYCPDICPTALSNISAALEKLGSKSKKIQPLFISVDPSRDTPENLNDYMENFHPSFIALTGTKEQVDQAKKAYRVYSANVDTEASQTTEYLIDHSSIVYFMSPKGRFITHFNHETDPDEMAKSLRKFL